MKNRITATQPPILDDLKAVMPKLNILPSLNLAEKKQESLTQTFHKADAVLSAGYLGNSQALSQLTSSSVFCFLATTPVFRASLLPPLRLPTWVKG